jgi:hypothetical protein
MVCLNLNLNGFNHRVWHAIVVLLPTGLGVFGYTWHSLGDGHYFFDPKHNPSPVLQSEGGEFGPHAQRYSDFVKLVITLSTGVIAFLVNTLANEKEPLSRTMVAIDSVAPIIVGFFGAAVALLVLFLVLQALWYEQYCNSELHDTYKRWKYAMCVSLGLTGLLAFVVGVTWFAQNLFT